MIFVHSSTNIFCQKRYKAHRRSGTHRNDHFNWCSDNDTPLTKTTTTSSRFRWTIGSSRKAIIYGRLSLSRSPVSGQFSAVYKKKLLFVWLLVLTYDPFYFLSTITGCPKILQQARLDIFPSFFLHLHTNHTHGFQPTTIKAT